MLKSPQPKWDLQLRRTLCLYVWRWLTPWLTQAFLEVEPHRRGLKEEYRVRYQTMAQQELDSALRQWDALMSQLGTPHSD